MQIKYLAQTMEQYVNAINYGTRDPFFSSASQTPVPVSSPPFQSSQVEEALGPLTSTISETSECVFELFPEMHIIMPTTEEPIAEIAIKQEIEETSKKVKNEETSDNTNPISNDSEKNVLFALNKLKNSIQYPYQPMKYLKEVVVLNSHFKESILNEWSGRVRAELEGFISHLREKVEQVLSNTPFPRQERRPVSIEEIKQCTNCLQAIDVSTLPEAKRTALNAIFRPYIHASFIALNPEIRLAGLKLAIALNEKEFTVECLKTKYNVKKKDIPSLLPLLYLNFPYAETLRSQFNQKLNGKTLWPSDPSHNVSLNTLKSNRAQFNEMCALMHIQPKSQEGEDAWQTMVRQEHAICANEPLCLTNATPTTIEPFAMDISGLILLTPKKFLNDLLLQKNPERNAFISQLSHPNQGPLLYTKYKECVNAHPLYFLNPLWKLLWNLHEEDRIPVSQCWFNGHDMDRFKTSKQFKRHLTSAIHLLGSTTASIIVALMMMKNGLIHRTSKDLLERIGSQLKSPFWNNAFALKTLSLCLDKILLSRDEIQILGDLNRLFHTDSAESCYANALFKLYAPTGTPGQFTADFEKFSARAELVNLLSTTLTHAERIDLTTLLKKEPIGNLLYIYYKRYQTLQDPVIREWAIADLLTVILDLTKAQFLHERYDLNKNPHLQLLFGNKPDLLQEWRMNGSHPVSSIIEKYQKDQLAVFLATKPIVATLIRLIGPQTDALNIFGIYSSVGRKFTILKDLIPNNGNSQFSVLIQEAVRQSQAELTTDSIAQKGKRKRPVKRDPDLEIQHLILQLLVQKEGQIDLTLLKTLHKSLETNNKGHAIRMYLQEVIRLSEMPSEYQGWKVISTDDPYNLLLSAQIAGPALNVDGNPTTTRCMPALLLNGENRALLVVNREGQIVASAVLRLLLDEKLEPVLIAEPLSASIEKYPKIVLEAVKNNISARFGIKKAEDSTGTLLHLGGRAHTAYFGFSKEVSEGPRLLNQR